MLVYNPTTPALRIRYQDATGKVSDRTVYPVSWITPTKMLAYCFTRQAFRHFLLDRFQALAPTSLTSDQQFAVETAIEQANLKYPDQEMACTS